MSETDLSTHSRFLTGFSKLLFSALVQTECCTLAVIPYGTLRHQQSECRIYFGLRGLCGMEERRGLYRIFGGET